MAADPIQQTEQRRAERYRKLPSVHEVLLAPELQTQMEAIGHDRMVAAVRASLAEIRSKMSVGEVPNDESELKAGFIARQVAEILQRGPEYSLRPVINATGVVLHTNLGRAPLSEAALAHLAEVARDYCNLEFDLETGERSKRDDHAERLTLRVLGVEDEAKMRWGAVVVNNCAAATFLALNTLADKREVVVSRGELVEIGGGFRIPEILDKSGASLREVGTTNRTRASDYEQAANEQTALLLRVHQSNFSMEGFVERPLLEELVTLSKTLGVPLFEDQGTGLVSRLDDLGITDQPTLAQSIRAGVDLVAASGDKLLGGPQCGLLVGRGDLIARIRKNPLLRALRVDKLTYAALEATLHEYLSGSRDLLPLMRMLGTSAEAIQKRCDALVNSMRPARASFAIVSAESVVGGGTAPSARLKSYAISLRHPVLVAEELLAKLRISSLPVIGRISEGAVLLDLRTVPPHMDGAIARAIEQL